MHNLNILLQFEINFVSLKKESKKEFILFSPYVFDRNWPQHPILP